MLFTKESDYAIRIVRALKDGKKIRAKDICEREEIPEAFAYKILKKLERAQVVRVIRGTHGGCMLVKTPAELCLYDLILAIEPDFAITHCIKKDCSRNLPGSPCLVHKELVRIQQMLQDELKAKSLEEILEQSN